MFRRISGAGASAIVRLSKGKRFLSATASARQAAKRGADEMHRSGRAPDHRFKNLCLVGNTGIESGAAFDCAAIPEQTCGDTAKTVLPLGNDGSPCSAGAA